MTLKLRSAQLLCGVLKTCGRPRRWRSKISKQTDIQQFNARKKIGNVPFGKILSVPSILFGFRLQFTVV